ncbi:MAG: hypothetical protein ACLQU9_11605 [Acidimicrobiales bacterium]|jgi:hypothetical protein
MQDDMVSRRTVVAAFGGLAVVAALVVGFLLIGMSPGSSARRSPVHSANPIAREAPITPTTQPQNPRSTSTTPGQINWTPAVESVGAMLSDGTDIVTVLTEPTPSAAGFEAACSKLADQPVPRPPVGSDVSASSSLQAVASDDAALVHDCHTTITDAETNSSNDPNAIADGENIGHALVALRSDAANFYLAIGYSGGQPSDPSGLSEWTLAKEIAFQQSDFPSGTVAVPSDPGAPYDTSPVAASPCSPVHSQPFVADYDSQTYDPSGIGNDYVYSEVLIMPPSDASAALEAIGAPGYDTTCFQPAFDADSEAMTPTTSCGSFRLTGSSISGLPATGFPPGSIVDRYVADMSCTGNGATGTWYTDVISAQVGSAFIQGTFNSYRTPVSADIEQEAMNKMAMRASALRSASA